MRQARQSFVSPWSLTPPPFNGGIQNVGVVLESPSHPSSSSSRKESDKFIVTSSWRLDSNLIHWEREREENVQVMCIQHVLTDWESVVGWVNVVVNIDILSTDNSNPLNADLIENNE